MTNQKRRPDWAPRLRPQLLRRLYESDARGIQDLELCDEVGMFLFMRCRTYSQKILLIDQLIHQFHIDEKTGQEVKSVASKLFEGNKKAVVRFLDELSACDPDTKQAWRRTVATTIDRRIVDSGSTNLGEIEEKWG